MFVAVKRRRIAFTSGNLHVLRRIAFHLLFPSVYTPEIKEENHFLASLIFVHGFNVRGTMFLFSFHNPKKSTEWQLVQLFFKNTCCSPKDSRTYGRVLFGIDLHALPSSIKGRLSRKGPGCCSTYCIK